jgi:hypothetical protein
MTIAGKPIPEGGYIVALQNGKKIALAQRRHRVIQAKIVERSEAEIAEQEGVAQYTIWKDIRAYLGEVRREDKEAVQAEYDLQRARYERLLLRWWDRAIGVDSDHAARATGIVLDLPQIRVSFFASYNRPNQRNNS